MLTDNKNRVALFAPIIRAYLSPCWCCKYCSYDCKGNIPIKLVITDNIRGPCELIMGKLNFRRFIMSKNRVHMFFATYDVNKPEGKRQTNSVAIYLPISEVIELCRQASCGELR